MVSSGREEAATDSTTPVRAGRARRWMWAAVIPFLAAQAPFARPVHSRTTATRDAREAFNRGLARSGEGTDGLRRRVHDFRRATELDRRFAEAHYALAETYLNLAGRRELPAIDALSLARSEALEALQLEEMPETRQLLGTVRLLNDWDWVGARTDLEAALRLAPTWDSALVSYARLLSAAGDDRHALAAINRAETVSPSCDLLLLDSGILYYRARRFDEALDKLRGALAFGPPRSSTESDWRLQVAFERFFVHVAQRDWRSAQADASAMMILRHVAEDRVQAFGALAPEDAVRRFASASVALMTGQAVHGRRLSVRIARMAATAHESSIALDWLERAADERDIDLSYSLHDPAFDLLQSDARFMRLARRVLGGAGNSAIQKREF